MQEQDKAMIRILDNLTINKIAAGEVIERPVNIVKELIENSLDANAKHISIEIKGGGIDYIRVTDDGCGISYDEVPTAFLRHATSKIVSSEDLFFLNTLGFRGEALASIASVSHTEMITKKEEELMGSRISLDGGNVIEFIKTGAPNGTTVIVKDMFFNTPARKKFLSSASAEATKIIETLEELALCNPDVAFQLTVNGQVKVQTGGSGNVKDIIYRLYGKEIHDSLIPLDYEDEFIKITGFITKPAVSRPSRSGENYFVNKRYVKNDYVTRGIEEGYRNFLMQHQFPFVVLYITLDSFGLDVNVHPAKAEVKITNGDFLVEILDQNIRKTLQSNELIPNAFPPIKEKTVLEKAPEPFEKSLIKGEHVIQKKEDSVLGKKSEQEAKEALEKEKVEEEARKAKEFTVDFSEKSEDSKPLNNHIKTIEYKSKSDRLEERMKNNEEDKEELKEELKSDVKEEPETVAKEEPKTEEKEEVKEEPKLEVVKSETKTTFTKASGFEENLTVKASDKPIENPVYKSPARLEEDKADEAKAEEVITDETKTEDKKQEEKTEELRENLFSTAPGKTNENTYVKNLIKDFETNKVDEKEDNLQKAKQLEEWMNSIKDKDEEEILKENTGLIIKIGKPKIEDEVDNDTFSDFDVDFKDNNEESAQKKADNNDRLLNADKKYSVLNDDIKPINTEDDKSSPLKASPQSKFRVKDFSKEEEEEIKPAKPGKTDFKRVDRFNNPDGSPKEEQTVLFDHNKLDPKKISEFKILDQIFDTYWLILIGKELLIMDQHAAHEKVLYEKFMQKFKEGKIETQTLAISQIVNLSKAEIDTFNKFKNEFERFGFIINDFGDRDLFIRGVPADMFGSDAKSLFMDILSELINVSPSLHIETIEGRIATRACKSAVKGNQKITKEDARKLLEYLLSLENPYQCPHGRPTMIRITQSDLERMFKRIV